MELQKLMRHKNITMTMRYAHLFPGQESEKLSIIGDMLASEVHHLIDSEVWTRPDAIYSSNTARS